MAKQTYLGAIFGSEADGYGIVFKDFPGCTSSASSLNRVVLMGTEALQGHVDVMLEFGDPLPNPTEHSLKDVEKWLDDDPENPLGEPWLRLVPIAVDIAPRKRAVHVDMPVRLLQEIGEVANDTRQFIMDATQRELERLRKSA